MIKIQNIYYMLAYAFQALNEDSYASIDTEKFDHIGDLFAAILSKGIANQIKRGLCRDYIPRTEALSSIRGKINMTASLQQNSGRKRQLVCEFDDFSENSYMNRVLKTTAQILIRSEEVKVAQKKALKKVMLYFEAVGTLSPHTIAWSGIRYDRNNATYRMLMNICHMVINGLLLTTREGTCKLARYLDDQQMHRLYEKFILEYYRKRHPKYNASPSQIDWNVDNNIFLPQMKTDIMLKHDGKILIIDAKYYAHTMQVNDFYDSRTIHSNNLYQIFTYVKNKDTAHTGNVSGVLLYARTDEEIIPDNTYIFDGNNIGVRTLNLNKNFGDITRQLDGLVNGYL